MKATPTEIVLRELDSWEKCLDKAKENANGVLILTAESKIMVLRLLLSQFKLAGIE